MAGWKLYVCFLVMVVIESGAAYLQCYACDPCSDPFDSNNAIQVLCPGSCVKGTVGGKVLRGCSDYKDEDKCTTQKEGEACYCSSNLCNSAPIHGISILGLISITIATFLWKS